MRLELNADSIIAGFVGGWEVVLALAIILILIGAKRSQGGPGGFSRTVQAFKETLDELSLQMRRGSHRANDADHRKGHDGFALWLAQGFDVGRIPVAPGTFGSLLGLLWVAILIAPGSLAFYLTGTVLGIGASVWACGEAERILGKTDPGSVVLDEIAALPVCFLPWIGIDCFRTGTMPSIDNFDMRSWYLTAMIFLLFRLFDVMKPWPVRQSQNLPGGWGVTMDDLLAAIYVGLVSLFLLL